MRTFLILFSLFFLASCGGNGGESVGVDGSSVGSCDCEATDGLIVGQMPADKCRQLGGRRKKCT